MLILRKRCGDVIGKATIDLWELAWRTRAAEFSILKAKATACGDDMECNKNESSIPSVDMQKELQQNDAPLNVIPTVSFPESHSPDRITDHSTTDSVFESTVLIDVTGETSPTRPPSFDPAICSDTFSIGSSTRILEDENEEMESGGLSRTEDRYRDRDSKRASYTQSPTTSSLIASTLLSLFVVLVLLISLRFLLPTTLELSRYSWFRGQLKAEYETAGDQLKQVSLESLNGISQTVARRVVPSVVHITTSADDGPLNGVLGRRAMTGHGSGVIIDSSGIILTNNHVLDDGPIVQVFLADERVYIAEKLGSDPFTDLAVLKIKADDLLPVSWGDSDRAEVGSPVWAVGSPFGLTGSITFGIVSSKHRLDLSGTQYDSSTRSNKEKKGPTARYSDLMQSDVAVNPGNSGGPLVNGRGELIGINTAIIGESYRGVSFAIPSNLAKQICDEIIKSGKMRRGWLGVEFVSTARWDYLQSEDLELYREQQIETKSKSGAVVSRVLAGSPAEHGDLRVGDRIQKVDGLTIKGVDDVIFRIGNSRPDSYVELELNREDEVVIKKIQIGQRPDS